MKLRWLQFREDHSPDSELKIIEQAFLERLATTDGKERGTVWDVTIIKAGQSKNKIQYQGKVGSLVYSREALVAAAPKFEGIKVYANRTGPHIDQAQMSTQDEVGWLQEVRMEGDEMRAKLYLVPSAQWLKEDLLFALDKNKKDFKELSINAGGSAVPRQDGNSWLFDVQSIESVLSVDVVPRGAAGGKFNNLLESHNNNPKGQSVMNKLKIKLLTLFTLLHAPFMESKKDVDWLKIDENELFTHLLEADKTQPRMKLPDGIKLSEAVIDEQLKKHVPSDGLTAGILEKFLTKLSESHLPGDDNKLALQLKEALDNNKKVAEQLTKMQEAQCKTMFESKLKASGLPVPLQEAIAKRFEGKVFTESEADTTIAAEKELYGKINPKPAESIYIQPGMQEFEKVQLGLDGFFLTSSQALKPVKMGTDESKALLKDIPPFRSIKEAYIMMTGDKYVTGEVDRKLRLTESINTSTFAYALADALNKRAVRDYQQLNLDTWRVFVDVVPLNDFKTQHRIRYGGYGNIPAVGQGAPYMPLTSPGDEEVTYTPSKKGGTEDITLEAIKNDDVGLIQRIPTRMMRAAAQTLHEFVYDFINPGVNPTYEPDSTALYHTNHANKGTSALDATSLAAARLRMKKQAMAGNNKRIGLRARYLILPSDLEKTGYDLLTPAFNQTNQTPSFIQQIGVSPIVVDYWTDGNDWVLVADRADITTIEIGFLDGQEMPELFISDLPNAGSWFTNDKLTYKIRHIYGGDILDYRGLDGSIVP